MGRSEEGGTVTARVVVYICTSLNLQWELLSLLCGDCLLVYVQSSAHIVLTTCYTLQPCCPAPLSVTRDDYLNTFDFLDKLADGLRTKMAT